MEDTQEAGVGKEKSGKVSSSLDAQSTKANLKEVLKYKRLSPTFTADFQKKENIFTQ